MKRIVSLSLGSSQQNFDRTVAWNGCDFHIAHFGCDGDLELLEQLIELHDGSCDTIALSCLPPAIQLGSQSLLHQTTERLQDQIEHTPWVDGEALRDIHLRTALTRAREQGMFAPDRQRLCFLSGISQWSLAQLLAPCADSLLFLDSYLHFRMPLPLVGLRSLEAYLQRMFPVLRRLPLRRPSSPRPLQGFGLDHLLRDALNADVIVATPRLLQWIELEALRDKTLLLDEMNTSTAAALQAAGVYNALYPTPPLGSQLSYLPLSVLEAMVLLSQADSGRTTEAVFLDLIRNGDLSSELQALYPERRESVRKYAFIIHPLSQKDLFRHPVLKPLTHLPPAWNKKLEHWLARVPGVPYGAVKGVRSELNGVQAEGLLYTLFATPREMLQAPPEAIYQRLIAVCEDAQRKGASIVGLGAFTKIVGDAGLTVAQRSPLPVTTGNSLSAAATLWAARDTCQRLGFVTIDRAAKQRIQGKVMVIGATGSIGKVCSKIVAQIFTHIVLAAPQLSRLRDLRQDLLALSPGAQMEVTTEPDLHAGDCDLIIIATSATDGGILAIDAIKPGCVVCDVGRPLTFSAQEAMRRPDVLIIESGEIELPGPVELTCDIGLEKSVVYACLAETALLALEGRFESFTLSRDIDDRKVLEIYKIAKKHGARLAAIRSPNGIVTQQEIDLCREHAEQSLRSWRRHEQPKTRVFFPAELHAGQ